jgi:predicted nucleic acid-binding protein
VSRWKELALSDAVLAYSPLSIAELGGMAEPWELEILRELFDSLVAIPVSEPIARRAGELLQIHRAASGLELAQAILAASAGQGGATLWTLNPWRYHGIADLFAYQVGGIRRPEVP